MALLKLLEKKTKYRSSDKFIVIFSFNSSFYLAGTYPTHTNTKVTGDI